MLSNALISSLTDHLQQALLVIDQNGQVVYCNDSATQFWQRTLCTCLENKAQICFMLIS